jgi:hypothetical protein
MHSFGNVSIICNGNNSVIISIVTFKKIGPLVLHCFDNVLIICNVYNNDIIHIVIPSQNWNIDIVCI